MKTIVLGITGGIAAFKALDLVKNLRNRSYNVIVIMTQSASKIINPQEFEKVSKNKVYTELFEKGFDYKLVLKKHEVDHIQIADSASVFVIVPATANFIAKVANGIADDFLTTTILATKAPVLICPSMNVNMWGNPIVQENISKCKKFGFQFIDPDSGMLACGYEGKGKLADIAKIEKAIEQMLCKTDQLRGKKIIVTAGGTIEPIDDVRFITNRSSGKMGAAVADVCYQRGAEVFLIRSTHAVKSRFSVREKTFNTADDLKTLLKKYALRYDFCFHSAAVSDFKLTEKKHGKIQSEEDVVIKLEPREKLLSVIKKVNPKIKLIGFKAEWGLTDEEIKQTAIEKIKEFNLEAVVANDVSKKDRGFETDTNEVLIVLRNGKTEKIKLASKREIAVGIVDYLTNQHVI